MISFVEIWPRRVYQTNLASLSVDVDHSSKSEISTLKGTFHGSHPIMDRKADNFPRE